MTPCLVCLAPADTGYHPACLLEVFGQPDVPALDLDLLHFPVEQWKMAGNVSISGLQPKLSMEITKEGLQTVEHGGRFILKPQSPKYRALPENEHLTMRLAMACGIVIPPCCLLALQDGTLAYVVRRYDRLPDGGRLRQEDFCQLNGWHADRKYEGSAELCVRLLRQHVPSPGPDIRQMSLLGRPAENAA